MRISEQEMSVYRKTARGHWAHKQQELDQRRRQAWILARQAGVLLKERFGVKQVVVFGSLVRGDLFHARSDVDLGVRGLDEKRYYRAVAQLLSLDPTIKIDMVMVEDTPDSLRATINQEGVVV